MPMAMDTRKPAPRPRISGHRDGPPDGSGRRERGERPGRRATLAIGGCLVLLFSGAPGVLDPPPAPRVSPAGAPDAADCALPGGDGRLHAGIPTPAGFAPSLGTVSALTLFIDFPDAEAEVGTRERFREFFPGTSRHFAVSSYGRLTYRPVPVHRWLRMPRPFAEYGIDRGVGWHPSDPRGYNRLMRDIVAAVEDSGLRVDFAAHDLVNVLAAPNAGPSALDKVLSVSFPGRPLIPTADGALRNVSFIWSRQPGESPYRVLVHENGHAFGLPDLYWTGPGTAPDLTGHWDVMEQDWGPSNDVMAWQKWKLEWLTDDQVACLTGPGTTELLVTPLGAEPDGRREPDGRPEPGQEAEPGRDTEPGQEAGAGLDTEAGRDGPAGSAPRAAAADAGAHGPSDGPAPADVRLVAIPTGPRRALTLEVRTRSELDRAVCRPGVLITRVDTAAPSGEGPLRVVDATPGSDGCQPAPDPQVAADLTDAAHRPGDSFRDERERVAVEILDAERDGRHRVRVTRW